MKIDYLMNVGLTLLRYGKVGHSGLYKSGQD